VSGNLASLLCALNDIASSPDFPAEARGKASGLVAAMTDFRFILTAHVYLRIFKVTTPLSKYLQTQGLDYIAASTMATRTTLQLEEISRDFEETFEAAKGYVRKANIDIEALCEEGQQMPVISSELQRNRVKRKKRMFDEATEDEIPENPLDHFRITVHNRIFDVTTAALRRAFEKFPEVAADLSLLHPAQFPVARDAGIPSSAFECLSKLAARMDPSLTKSTIQDEYVDFANKWNLLKNCNPVPNTMLGVVSGHGNEADASDSDMGDEGIAPHTQTGGKPCTGCQLCVFRVLVKYRLYCEAYSHLYLAYKVALSLSCTQVACERCFSKLKFLKNRLRSRLTEEHLEAMMLMSVERDVLAAITNEEVLAEICRENEHLADLLCFG
jgi:hypothetical protein